MQTLNPNPNSSGKEEALREDKLQGGIVRRDYRGKTFRRRECEASWVLSVVTLDWQPFFSPDEISPKNEITKTNLNWSDSEGFSIAKSQKINSKNWQIFEFGFQCVDINRKGWQKILYFIFSL